eukprot:1345975-Amphidinium_carterae.1
MGDFNLEPQDLDRYGLYEGTQAHLISTGQSTCHVNDEPRELDFALASEDFMLRVPQARVHPNNVTRPHDMVELTFSKTIDRQQLPQVEAPRPHINYADLLPDGELSKLDDITQVEELAHRFQQWSQQTEELLPRLHGLESHEWDAGREEETKYRQVTLEWLARSKERKRLSDRYIFLSKLLRTLQLGLLSKQQGSYEDYIQAIRQTGSEDSPMQLSVWLPMVAEWPALTQHLQDAVQKDLQQEHRQQQSAVRRAWKEWIQEQAFDHDRQLHNYIKKQHVHDADPLHAGHPVTGHQGLQQVQAIWFNWQAADRVAKEKPQELYDEASTARELQPITLQDVEEALKAS